MNWRTVPHLYLTMAGIVLIRLQPVNLSRSKLALEVDGWMQPDVSLLRSESFWLNSLCLP